MSGLYPSSYSSTCMRLEQVFALLLYIINCRLMHCSLNKDWRQRAH